MKHSEPFNDAHRQITFFEGKCRRFRILMKVQRLTTPRILDQFGRKRCQAIAKEWARNRHGIAMDFLRHWQKISKTRGHGSI